VSDTRTAEIAQRVREHIVDMCAGPEGGHLGGSLSVADILSTLYCEVLRVDPARPDDPGRDIFLLSKGHGALALYAVLAECGFLPASELATFGRPGSALMGHPSRDIPGVEMPAGALGHGLALGNGFALADRSRRCFVLMGDGELQEGSVWEAAMAASSLRLGNLTAIVDRNGLQLTGPTEQTLALEPLADRWRAFGWAVREVSGHDRAALAGALSAGAVTGQPVVVLAKTVKGHGLPFLQGRPESHFARLSERQHARARAVLRAWHRREAA
jgi:transketolase